MVYLVPGRTEKINYLHNFVLLFETEQCFILKKLLESLRYMHLQLTIDAYSLFLYLEHTTIFMLVMFFCCIYLSHFKGQTLKLLSDFKPVHGPKKVGDR